MNPSPTLESRARAAPIVRAQRSSAAPLISLQAVVVLLLVLEFWKVSGVRYWPHSYVGEQYSPHRLVYYTEFLISICSLAALSLRSGVLLRSARQQGGLVLLFAVYAFVAGQFVKAPLAIAFLTVVGYLEAWVVLNLALVVIGPAATLRVLVQAGFALVLLNLASAAVPSVSVMIGEFAGRFRGLTSHRNDLSQLAYFCALVAVAARQLVPRWMFMLTFIGAVALIGAARSVQGILLLPFGLFVYQFSSRIRILKHPLVMLSALVLLCIGVFVWEQFGTMDRFLRFFGRDATFTGRDRIWALSLHLLEHMPFWGYGPGQMGSGVLSLSLLERFGLGTLFSSAHSSYLEAFLTYGWVGGSLFVATLLVGVFQVVRAVLKRSDTYAGLALALLVTGLMGGLAASEKLFLPTLGWFSFVLSLVLAQSRHTTPRL